MQFEILVEAGDKDLLIFALIKLQLIHGKVLFFVNSIDSCYRLKLFFEQFGIKSAVLNAELPHKSRSHIIQEFNKGLFDFLIATDESVDKENNSKAEEAIDEAEESDEDGDDEEQKKPISKKKIRRDKSYGVARGIDFRGVNYVVNVDFPTSVRSYKHRIGRTARGGATGTALSLVAKAKDEEWDILAAVQDSQPTLPRDVCRKHCLYFPLEGTNERTNERNVLYLTPS